MAAVEQPKNMLDKFLDPNRVLSDGKLSLRMYSLILNPYFNSKDVNDICFDASSHPSKTYFSQVVDEVKDLECSNSKDWDFREPIALKSRQYKNNSKSKSYVKGYRKYRRTPPNKNKDKYVESVHLVKSLRSRNKTNKTLQDRVVQYIEHNLEEERLTLLQQDEDEWWEQVVIQDLIQQKEE